ncbi:MAG: hypothetical protein IPH91_06400 [Elusimicrobia bacterium]|nr:hypothetical protein [Elusimicrobiota bacterium]MBK8422377.1 hypothetical protein [Elusimicrobiota bacterium]
MDARLVGFAWDGLRGNYTQLLPRLQWTGARGRVAGVVPVVRADARGASAETGLGNPTLHADVWSGPWTLSVQLELPLGDDDKGLAADHTGVLPFVAYTARGGGWTLTPRFGYRHSLDSEGHGHVLGHHVPLLVNPHADDEFVYQLAASRAAVTAYIDGQHALKGEEKGSGYSAAGMAYKRPLRAGPALRLWTEWPLTAPRRFEWKVGAGVEGRF